MFRSLKSWVNIPVQIKPCTGRAGTGMKLFGATINAVCYPEGKIELIQDTTGAEVVSNTRLYFDGNTAINVLDNVVFEGTEYSIKNISTYYSNGAPDIKVVFL